jgi:hypothetical protein
MSNALNCSDDPEALSTAFRTVIPPRDFNDVLHSHIEVYMPHNTGTATIFFQTEDDVVDCIQEAETCGTFNVDVADTNGDRWCAYINCSRDSTYLYQAWSVCGASFPDGTAAFESFQNAMRNYVESNVAFKHLVASMRTTMQRNYDDTLRARSAVASTVLQVLRAGRNMRQVHAAVRVTVARLANKNGREFLARVAVLHRRASAVLKDLDVDVVFAAPSPQCSEYELTAADITTLQEGIEQRINGTLDRLREFVRDETQAISKGRALPRTTVRNLVRKALAKRMKDMVAKVGAHFQE